MPENQHKLITILGPTAVGKTGVAVALAHRIGGEIISGDSRQVYRKMDIGTGKDLADYTIDGQQIPYHLIDIVDAGYKYNVFEYQRDFHKAYNDICARGKQPILCGGTGMYIEAVVNGYEMSEVPANPQLRAQLEAKSDDELVEILKSLKTLHNKTDYDTRKRAIRAIEIEIYQKDNNIKKQTYSKIDNVYFGISVDLETRRRRITERLDARLKNGMIDEVKSLIDGGINANDMIYYGLEYKYLTLYILGKMSYSEMRDKLNIEIHRFAKRQMTWFRGMERKGAVIHWVDGTKQMSDKVDEILKILES